MTGKTVALTSSHVGDPGGSGGDGGAGGGGEGGGDGGDGGLGGGSVPLTTPQLFDALVCGPARSAFSKHSLLPRELETMNAAHLGSATHAAQQTSVVAACAEEQRSIGRFMRVEHDEESSGYQWHRLRPGCSKFLVYLELPVGVAADRHTLVHRCIARVVANLFGNSARSSDDKRRTLRCGENPAHSPCEQDTRAGHGAVSCTAPTCPISISTPHGAVTTCQPLS